MTFRIDWISLNGSPHRQWECAFKGFRGQGIYGRAFLDESRTNLVLESTMDASQREVIPVNAAPDAASREELRIWIAHQLEGLGWGPEVSQANKLIKPDTLARG